MKKNMKKIFCLFIILFTITSCFGGRSQPSNFYNIISIDNNDTKIKSRRKLTIGIDLVSIPGYLDRNEIITLKSTSDTELNIDQYNRWAEPLSSSIQRVILDDMSKYLTNATIRPLNLFRKYFDYSVIIYINRFEGRFNDKVYLDAWYSISNRDGVNVLNDKVNFDIELNSNNYNDLVEMQSVLINKLSQNIAKNLSKL